jgi:hypothetical protein
VNELKKDRKAFIGFQEKQRKQLQIY